MLASEGITGQTRLENIEELKSTIRRYEDESEEPTLGGFLEEVALYTDVDSYSENDDAVVLMTLHAAKGLEFPLVWIPGMEEGLFPSMRSLGDPEQLEEERRLAYGRHHPRQGASDPRHRQAADAVRADPLRAESRFP